MLSTFCIPIVHYYYNNYSYIIFIYVPLYCFFCYFKRLIAMAQRVFNLNKIN